MVDKDQRFNCGADDHMTHIELFSLLLRQSQKQDKIPKFSFF